MQIRRMLMANGGAIGMVGEFSKVEHLTVVPTYYAASSMYNLSFTHSLGETPKLFVVKSAVTTIQKYRGAVGHVDIAGVARALNKNNLMQNVSLVISQTIGSTLQNSYAYLLPDRVILTGSIIADWDGTSEYSVDVYA